MASKTNLSRSLSLEADVEARLEKLSNSTRDEKVAILRHISPKLGLRESRNQFSAIVHSSTLIQTLSELLSENIQWSSNPPTWAKNLITNVYFEVLLDVPENQTISLVSVFKRSYLAEPSANSLEMLRYIARSNKTLLANDKEIFDIIQTAVVNEKFNIAKAAILFLQTATDNDMGWQKKVLENAKFIASLMSLPAGSDVWYLFANLSQHPDAKVLLPQKLLERAKKEQFEGCIDVCANLISEADADSLVLESEYVENRAQLLQNLLAIQNQVGSHFTFSLLDLILPLVNLAVSDANKENLGKLVVELLLKVLSIRTDKPLITNIETNLERSKQEAAKALWNLAFTEPNRKRIADAGGIEVLTQLQQTTQDSVLKRNVSGILYMFENRDQKPSGNSSNGHVMISYNWDNQPLVIRLAKSLKHNGYQIWLDVEQMGGSTLEAMASAVEGSALVLLCMSRKYKDSPNCRLEGEYVVNRKVPFLPLMMQDNYRPDGWLGITLGAKLYYDFTNEENWDAKVNELVKGMGVHGKLNNEPHYAAVPAISPPAKLSALNWGPEELESWMKAEGIERYRDKFRQHFIDGRALLEIKALLLSSQNVLSFLSENLGITEIGELFRITSAIRKL